MGMMRKASYPLFPSGVGIATVTLFGWTALSVTQGGMKLPTALLWGMIASLGLWAVLEGLDYFNSLRPLPRRSDCLVLWLALPWPALVGKYLLFFWLGEQVLRYRDILFSSAWLAGLAYLYQWAEAWALRKTGWRRQLALLVTERERNDLIHELSSRGLDSYFEIRRDGLSTSDLIVMSREAMEQRHDHAALLEAHLKGVKVLDYRPVMAELHGRVELRTLELWSYLAGATTQTLWHRLYATLKVFSDPILAGCLMLFLSPVALVVAILVKTGSAGPILFRQRRTGLRGETFEMLKFRTMRVDSEPNGPVWSLPGDARLTKVGKFLRKTRLDEMPQLWNIICGEMAFIGPRPERPEFYAELREAIPLFHLRALVRPGITGWAQVLGGYAASIAASARKLEYDLYYIQHLSPRLDLIVIAKTVSVLFFGEAKRVAFSVDMSSFRP